MVDLQKKKPYRSKKFLAFCHEEMKPAPCAVCQEEPFVQLHHFGDDGGKGLKPSDNMVVRTCISCHNKYGLKRLSLIKNQRYSLLETFEYDALLLNRAYMEYLESK